MSSLQKMMSVFMLNSEVGSDLKMALTMGAFAKTKQSLNIPLCQRRSKQLRNLMPYSLETLLLHLRAIRS